MCRCVPVVDKAGCTSWRCYQRRSICRHRTLASRPDWRSSEVRHEAVGVVIWSLSTHRLPQLGAQLRVARASTSTKALALLQRGSKTTIQGAWDAWRVPARANPGHNLGRQSGVTVLTPMPTCNATFLGGGSVQHGLSDAGGVYDFYEHCSAADKR
jgi:hypothetical protein